MTTLDEQIERERSEAGDEAPVNGVAHGDDDAKAEARKAKDRERKRKEREASGAKPRKPRATTDAKPEKELDPRVARAVQMCMASMLVDEVTPEFAKEMGEALHGAIAYELEVRLPLLADGFEPEIGLGCAVVGAGVTRFRLKRAETRKRKHDPVVVRDAPSDPPVESEGGAAGGQTA